VTCHTDDDGITCSNDVKCPDGISSYSSNFTFGQNQADTWNPNSQNQADVLVQQQQHIAVSSCAKFSLTSDGTRDGTHVEEEGFAGENTCPKIQNPPKSTRTVDMIFAEKPSLTGRPPTGVTIIPQMLQSNLGPRRGMSKSMYSLAVLIILVVLLPGAYASAEIAQRNELRKRAELRVRDVRDKVEVFAQDFSKDLAERVTAHGTNGELFAHNLVANVVSSVCDEYFKGTKPGDFTPVIVENCVKSVYGGAQLEDPNDQFSAVFGASLLCGYIVSEAYPAAQEFLPSGCDGLRGLAERISQAGSATMPILATVVASQTSRPLVSESSIIQSPDFGQTVRISEFPINPSFIAPLLPPQQSNTPDPSTARSQLSSLGSNTIQTPPGNHPSGSGLGISLLTFVTDNKASSSFSDRASSVVVVTHLSQSTVPSEPTLASPQLFPSEEGHRLHEATTGLSRQASFASRSLIDMLPSSASRASRPASSQSTSSPSALSHSAPSQSASSQSASSQSASSQSHPDALSPSQSTLANSPPLPSFSGKSSLLLEWVLSSSSSTVAQSFVTRLEQISQHRSTADPTPRIGISDLPTSQSYVNLLIPPPSLPTSISPISSSNSSTRTPVQIATSYTVDSIVAILSGNAPVNRPSLVANTSSVPTIQPSDKLHASNTIPSLNISLPQDDSAATIRPAFRLLPTVGTNSADFCTKSVMTESTHCSQNSSGCCKNSSQRPGTNQSRPGVAWGFSLSNHSHTFATLPSMQSLDASWALPSASRTASSITQPSTHTVHTTGLEPGHSSATASASLVSPVSHSPTEKPTSGRSEAGGFIAKGFDGWW
jgi:hypothetical protein